MSSKQEMDKIVRQHQLLGWTVTKTKKHWKFVPPGGGPFVIAGSTPGGTRALENLKASLRRAERALRQQQPDDSSAISSL